jgi:glycosyltransferase involved in cell wall biosynthesis
VRICILYDCLFPYTVGGAERWYRNLAEHLAADGHEVVYATLRQWDRDEVPDLEGVEVVSVGPRMELYTAGRRRILPPLVFGLGVLRHLVRQRYDVVHCASFPYFSLLAAGLLARRKRFRLVVDWHEVWSRSYWREYLGPAGAIGWLVQRACARLEQRAFCFSRLHAGRLRELGLRSEPTILEGEYAGPLDGPTSAAPPEALVVFAGRHIPEKRAVAAVTAIALASSEIDGLRGVVFGDGPERPAVLAEIARLSAPVEAPGFVPPETIHETLGRSLCMLLPSRREGYGLIVVEAASSGIPSVVVAEPDNAAVELLEDGVNGIVAASAAPSDLAAAIVAVHRAGESLRASTRAWWTENAGRLSLESSLRTVLDSYR